MPLQTLLLWQPQTPSLTKITTYAEQRQVLAAAIDAPLTWARGEENGMRSSDHQLKTLLPSDCRNWVMSQNSLIMAVTVRGHEIAELLSPIVGTIIETHPRCCLLFAFPRLVESIKAYKGQGADHHVRLLWEAWVERFGIPAYTPARVYPSHGALDALVCSTVAYLFHVSPELLMALTHDSPHRRGRGPFYVTNYGEK